MGSASFVATREVEVLAEPDALGCGIFGEVDDVQPSRLRGIGGTPGPRSAEGIGNTLDLRAGTACWATDPPKLERAPASMVTLTDSVPLPSSPTMGTARDSVPLASCPNRAMGMAWDSAPAGRCC